MDLKFNEEQIMIQDSVRSLIQKEFNEDIISELCQQKEYPEQFDEKIAELGLYGICTPESYGGADCGPLEAAIIIEEVSRYSIDLGISFGLNLGVALAIQNFGSESQKEHYLEKMISGEISFSVGYYEPFLFEDKTKISGSLSGKDIRAEAIYTEKRVPEKNHILLPVLDGETLKMVIIPQKGLGSGEAVDLLGRDLLGLTQITGIDLAFPEEVIFEKGEEVWSFMTLWLKFINLMSCIGNMQTVVEETIQYSKEREQYGRPIGTFQALIHMMVEPKVKVDASRWLGYWVAWLFQENMGNVEKIVKEINMASTYVTGTFTEAVVTGMQVTAGYGYSKEYNMERYSRDSRMTCYYVNDAFLQKLTIADKLGIPAVC